MLNPGLNHRHTGKWWDWEKIDYNDLKNKPTLATVATSWSYDDLSDKPSIPDNTDYCFINDRTPFTDFTSDLWNTVQYDLWEYTTNNTLMTSSNLWVTIPSGWIYMCAVSFNTYIAWWNWSIRWIEFWIKEWTQIISFDYWSSSWFNYRTFSYSWLLSCVTDDIIRLRIKPTWSSAFTTREVYLSVFKIS
jgi:hypothetical protein